MFQNFLVLGFDTFLVISTFLRREMLIRFYLILSVNTPNLKFNPNEKSILVDKHHSHTCPGPADHHHQHGGQWNSSLH